MVGRRRHHFVPACYLANFTPQREREGSFFAVDLQSGEARPSTPNNEGWQRGLYNVDVPGEELELIENMFAEVEGHVAPLLRDLVDKQRLPGADGEMGSLLYFMALQMTRTPRVRAGLDQAVTGVMRSRLRAASASQKAFEATVLSFDEQTRADLAGLTLEDVRETAEVLRVEMDQTTHVKSMLRSAERVFPYFAARSWSLLVSPQFHPDFITCDNPVVVMPAAGTDLWPGPAGLARPDAVIILPLSPRLAMLGSAGPEAAVVEAPGSTVAALNGAICLAAERFVWGRRPRFLYMMGRSTFRDPMHLTKRPVAGWQVT